MSKKKGGLTGAQWHSMLKRFTIEDECFAIQNTLGMKDY